MLNSVLLLGSCYNKNKKISLLFTLFLLLNLVFTQFGQVKLEFFICNFLLMLIMSVINKKINNKIVNTISSVFSILLWSLCIDLISYYMFPIFSFKINIVSYILNGIIFNFKYVVFNLLFVIAINIIELCFNKINVKIKELRFTKIEKESLCI